MHTIICKQIKKEKTFNQGYIVDVELVEGSPPQSISFADQVQCKDTIFLLPIHLIETNREGICRLFFNTSAYEEQKRLNLEKQLKSQLFKLYFSEYSCFELQPNCKKILLLIEESALFESLAIIDFLALEKIDAEVYVKAEQQREIIDYLQYKMGGNITLFPSFEDKEVRSIFNEQVIGTNLYISGSWSTINHVVKIAADVGYTDVEIQFRGLGIKKQRIMCVKCYSFNTNQAEDEIDEMTCKHCSTVLEVPGHYSRRLGAYLGYVKVDEIVTR